MNQQNIINARRLFLEAVETYSEANEQTRQRDIDVGIAQRTGDAEEIAKAQKVQTEHASKVWLPAYQEKKHRAQELCRVLDIEPSVLKGALG